MTRYSLFGITILIGLAASMYLGWAARPVTASDAVPASLREDFRADYALMVAESFAADHRVERAIEYLAFLNEENPLSPVVDAVEFGQEHNYSADDLDLLTSLAQALVQYDASFAATATP